MDRDTFIIAVYCIVVEHYHTLTAQRPLRRGGFSPTLSDEEVITMEICGEYFKLPSDKDIWQYFRAIIALSFPLWATARALSAKRPTYGRSKRLSNSA